MNTAEEIRQAYLDFHSGKFGGPTPAALELAEPGARPHSLVQDAEQSLAFRMHGAR
jgi:hypothetical protein